MKKNNENGQELSEAKKKAIEDHNKKYPNDKLPVTTNIPWKVIRSKRNFTDIRISETKKNIILKEYAQRFNKAKAAYKAGLSVRAVYYEMENNPEFKEQMEEIEQAHKENMIETGFQVASIPTREGATDRKTFLPAFDDRFKNKPVEINNNLSINLHNSIPSARNILQKYNAVNADYKVLPTDD